MSFLLHQSRFFTTVNHLRDLPATPQPEIAFAGRSNAGKSTAINMLCNQKRLAFASKTPGRTQHINYFSVGKADEPTAHLVDLPGYGYAEVPGAAKAHWEALLSTYLQSALAIARHDPDDGLAPPADRAGSPHDRVVRADRQADPHVADEMRQIDAPGKHQRVARDARKVWMSTRAAGYQGELTAQLFSALKRVGIDEAHELIESWLIPERRRARRTPRSKRGERRRRGAKTRFRLPIKKPAA